MAMLARWLALPLLLLAGCSHATLPYKPEPQPRGAKLSADYRLVADRLRIEIDSSGRRLEQAWIFRPDGVSVAPDTVESPRVVTGSGPIFSVGGGGASFGRGVSVSSGVGVGFPIGSGPSRLEGNTILWFPLASVGPAPWQLYVKLAGVEPASFQVGGPPPR
jgi:hypothetical protein